MQHTAAGDLEVGGATGSETLLVQLASRSSAGCVAARCAARRSSEGGEWNKRCTSAAKGHALQMCMQPCPHVSGAGARIVQPLGRARCKASKVTMGFTHGFAGLRLCVCEFGICIQAFIAVTYLGGYIYTSHEQESSLSAHISALMMRRGLVRAHVLLAKLFIAREGRPHRCPAARYTCT